MTLEIEIPGRLPMMTLPETVFFPQAMLPLHIFEDRYRKMLKDVLSNHRMFAVCALDEKAPGLLKNFEPPCRVATAGIIRACRKNEDGTANLVMQGLCRVEIKRIVSEAPYRFAEIIPLATASPQNKAELIRLKGRLLRCIGVKRRLGSPVSKEMLAFLKNIEEPEVLVDLAAFSLCEDAGFKQTLLETLDTGERMEMFIHHLMGEIEEMRLWKKLQGGVDDEDIGRN